MSLKYNSDSLLLLAEGVPVDRNDFDATLFKAAMLYDINDGRIYYSDGVTWVWLNEFANNSNFANVASFALSANNALNAANAEFALVSNTAFTALFSYTANTSNFANVSALADFANVSNVSFYNYF